MNRTLHNKRHKPTQTPITPVPRWLLPVAGAFLLTPSMHASLLGPCQPGDSEFLCQLRSVLTLLDVAAILLGLLLLIAVFAAIRAYRRKPRKIAPEDISPDAR